MAARWPGTEPRQRLASLVEGWRGLGRFWLAVLVVLTAVGVTLQILGPPPGRPARTVASLAPAPREVPAASQQAAQPKPPSKPVPRPGRDTPGPIADPDPALQEPVAGSLSELLPRIAGDGRMPMQVYAAGFDASTRRPRIGLLIAGVGLNQADSLAAVRALPGGITLAISPYAPDTAKLLAAARLAEHEYLLSIPMEPQGYPLNDPGPKALMTNLAPEDNHLRLEWSLSRIAGYAGATGALGTLRGERFASLPEQVNPVLEELARRGLLYVDARQGAPPLPFAWSRTVDIVVDEPPNAADIDDKLGRLARLARDNGSALGLASMVRPVTTERIAVWANGLAADGFALAPVSALARAPSAKPAQ